MATDFSGRSGHQLVADFKSAVGRLGPLVAGEKDSLIGVSSGGRGWCRALEPRRSCRKRIAGSRSPLHCVPKSVDHFVRHWFMVALGRQKHQEAVTFFNTTLP